MSALPWIAAALAGAWLLRPRHAQRAPLGLLDHAVSLDELLRALQVEQVPGAAHDDELLDAIATMLARRVVVGGRPQNENGRRGVPAPPPASQRARRRGPHGHHGV